MSTMSLSEFSFLCNAHFGLQISMSLLLWVLTATAYDTGILIMEAVVFTPRGMVTTGQISLSTHAHHIIQPDPTTAFTILVIHRSYSWYIAQRATHHRCVQIIPIVITYRSPFAIMKDLYSAVMEFVAICKADLHYNTQWRFKMHIE